MSFADTDFVLDAGLLIPVLALHDDDDLEPLAEALVAGGIQVFEVVLRTPTALQSLKRLKGRVPVLGAGTVLNRAHMQAAQDAGAQFCVSPGLTPALHKSARDLDMPLLPGAVTASEIMTSADLGYRNLKFFPAERVGGVQILGDFEAVFPNIRFCPTGGISQENAGSYLNKPNVACVGGSLTTPKDLILAKNWDALHDFVCRLVAGLAASIAKPGP